MAEALTCEDGQVPSTLDIVTETRFSIETLFDISLDIDAHVASMSSSKERAVAGVTRGRIGLGESVTWRARHFGVWFRLTSKVTELSRPHRFVDEQVRGPFAVFRHEHVFTEVDGRSIMIDRLTVGSPILGGLAERLILVPYLRRLIEARNRALIAGLQRATDGGSSGDH